MADIRQSSGSEPSKTIFDAESVAGDLWMRQNYHDIHLELNSDETTAFVQSAEGAGLILERSNGLSGAAAI
ncbi:MAG: hypothetical protein JOY62_19465 [Acidobacteriaceae bacterium]|nr:hypothetical protein [Acidobacteriaceae bacterium]MBV9782146.1 hypothetical protein [Acidobacteriaceae bacterium]